MCVKIQQLTLTQGSEWYTAQYDQTDTPWHWTRRAVCPQTYKWSRSVGVPAAAVGWGRTLSASGAVVGKVRCVCVCSLFSCQIC